MSYLFLKSFHIISAMATIFGFLLRGFWMLRESEMLQHRFVRVAPHVVDTVFLFSGVAMLWLMPASPPISVESQPNKATSPNIISRATTGILPASSATRGRSTSASAWVPP